MSISGSGSGSGISERLENISGYYNTRRDILRHAASPGVGIASSRNQSPLGSGKNSRSDIFRIRSVDSDYRNVNGIANVSGTLHREMRNKGQGDSGSSSSSSVSVFVESPDLIFDHHKKIYGLVRYVANQQKPQCSRSWLELFTDLILVALVGKQN